jgi:hypothetical protein
MKGVICHPIVLLHGSVSPSLELTHCGAEVKIKPKGVNIVRYHKCSSSSHANHCSLFTFHLALAERNTGEVKLPL